MTTLHPSETPDMTHKPLFGDLIASHPGLADELKAMTTLHDQIMNLRCKPAGASVDIYKEGHRDARHAAAELAIASDARIAELERVLREAEILCEWISQSPSQRGSINGKAAQVGYSISEILKGQP